MKSNTKKKILVGDIEFNVLKEKLVPPISDEEYQRLKDDIEENGVLVPIAINEQKCIIDGINRTRAASELGMKSIPFHMHCCLDKEETLDLSIKLNALRRQWGKDQRLSLAVSLRKDKYSYRRIGKVLNLSHETVRRHLNSLGDTEDFPDTNVGADGVERTSKPRKASCVVVNNKAEANRLFKAQNESKGKVEPFDSFINVKNFARKVKKNNRKNTDASICSDTVLGNANLLLGDFRENGNKIEDESVDIIFTDPPYAESALPLWDALGEFANRTLKPGGVLLSYSGNMYLPQIHAMLGKHLQYFWTFAIRHTGGNTFIRQLNIQQTYKPIVAYCKPPLNPNWGTFCDMVSGGREKEDHEWQQAVEEAHYYIKHVSTKGGTLCDPMMGSGTSIIAGLSLGLDCIGIEIDTTAYANAKERIESVNKSLCKKAA